MKFTEQFQTYQVSVRITIGYTITFSVRNRWNSKKLEIWGRAQREAARGVRNQALINF